MSYKRSETRLQLHEVKEKHRGKFQCLADYQETPLRNVKNTVLVVVDFAPPQYFTDLLSLGPKHPIRDRFNEMHFLADVDRSLSLLKSEGSTDEVINDINAISNIYMNYVKKQRPDHAAAKENEEN